VRWASTEIAYLAHLLRAIATGPVAAAASVDDSNRPYGLLQSMVHGKTQKRLDIQRIAEINAAAGIFLTLHGGSGTYEEDLEQAIKVGIPIVHVISN
jgi:hypothetical protein